MCDIRTATWWLSMRARMVLLGMLLAGLSAVWSGPATAQELHWRPFEKALAVADSTGRPVLVDVYAPWCGWCRKMKRDVYPSEDVRSCLTEAFVITRLNRDDTETTHRYHGQRLSSLELAQTLRVAAVPTIVFLAPNGEYLFHLPGFIEAEVLRSVLSYMASGAYRHQSFETFRARKADSEGSC